MSPPGSADPAAAAPRDARRSAPFRVPASAQRGVRLAVAAVVASWAILGVVRSVNALVPATRERLRAGDAPPTVGMPTAMTAVVVSVRDLLVSAGSGSPGRWLVALPPDAPPLFESYVRYQLNYLMYPRVVDVSPAGGSPPLDAYDGVVAGPGTRMPDPWTPVGARGGFTAFRRP